MARPALVCRFLALWLLLSLLRLAAPTLHAQSGDSGELGEPIEIGTSDSSVHDFSVGDKNEELGDAAAARRDSSDVTPRTPSASKLRQLRANHDFDYSEQPDTTSIAADISRWFQGGPPDKSESSFPWGTVLEVLAYLILAGTLGLLVYSLIQSRPRKGTPAPSSGGEESGEAGEDRIEGVEFEHEIEAALARGDFRRASRLLYLRSLKQLSDRGRIIWKPEKTNHDYLRELGSGELARSFARVTLLFDYIWYGDFRIDDHAFSTVRLAFDRFAAQLSERAHGA